MGPRQAARMPQTLQSSKYSPIGGARCTLSRVLDSTSPVHEEAPRSMVNLRVSGVWAYRAFSMGPRQAARMPQTLQSSKYSPIGGPPCALSRVFDHPNRPHETTQYHYI